MGKKITFLDDIFVVLLRISCAAASGVEGPLAAQGGGRICRPFVLGF